MEKSTEQFIVTIAGIRHYIDGGERGVDQFKSKHPVGSSLYLQMQGGTGPFSRAVIAMDASMQVVGSVCANDSYIARAFFLGDNAVKVERATIVEYLPLAIKVSVRNIGQSENQVYVFDNKDDADHAFALSNHEQRGMRLAAHIEFMAGCDLDNEALSNLLACVREYKDVCMYSISGEAIYERRNVAKALAKSAYTQLQLLANDIDEAANDMGKPEFQLRAFQKTWSDMKKESAGEMEKYMKSLTFGAADVTIPDAKKEEEIKTLTNALKSSLEGKFAEVYDDQQQIAQLIYYFKYSRRQVALLVTRMLKLEALTGKQEPAEMSDDERVRLAIIKIMDMTDKKGEWLMKNKSQWYGIYRVLSEKKYGYTTMTGFVAYVKKLLPEGTRVGVDESDLKKNNMGCFLKPVSNWNEAQAPVKGAVFAKFLAIAREFEKLL